MFVAPRDAWHAASGTNPSVQTGNPADEVSWVAVDAIGRLAPVMQSLPHCARELALFLSYERLLQDLADKVLDHVDDSGEPPDVELCEHCDEPGAFTTHWGECLCSECASTQMGGD